jgi:hypothetical protein
LLSSKPTSVHALPQIVSEPAWHRHTPFWQLAPVTVHSAPQAPQFT